MLINVVVVVVVVLVLVDIALRIFVPQERQSIPNDSFMTKIRCCFFLISFDSFIQVYSNTNGINGGLKVC